MSGRHPRRAGHVSTGQVSGERRARGSARAERFVAVLERHGRFLTAERLFPHERASGMPLRRSGPVRLVVGSARAARGVRASAGDLVLVQGPGKGSQARIVRVLGRPQVARDVIEGLLLDRGMAREFGDAVEREARDAAQAAAASAVERRDLRGLPTFTIDPVSARDFDDALSAQQAPDGCMRIWVHIADVSAHVREGGALDREARKRATSVYVPGTVEPMLPHALSSGACSLRPGEDRLAVTVELELEGAALRRSSFYRSLIRSDARLDYEQVDRIFSGAERAQHPWAEPLALARESARALQRARESAGALVVDSQEPEFFLDERGEVVSVEAREQTESHRLVEHMMIAANEAVASLLAARKAPCLFRVHERPDPERIVRLVEQLDSLEVPTPPLPERMSPSQAADLVGEVSLRLEQHLRRTGHGRAALSSLLLRSLKQAYYSPRNLGHAGLGLANYCHFTSPIRRYPDLVCHRALLWATGAGEQPVHASELGELGVWTSERERDAMSIERAGDDIARCFALERVLREGDDELTFDGEVSGLIPAGVFVSFGVREEATAQAQPQAPFEGMLPVRELRTLQQPERDWWELNEYGTMLQAERSGATLRLGDPLRVRVERIEAVRGRVDLAPAI